MISNNETDGPAGADLPDERRDAPTFHRNHQPIRAVLADYLSDVTGHALEIGSGTGQHVISFARGFPGLTWWPSDLQPANLRSIDAWRRHSQLENVSEPVAIDASSDDWQLGIPDRPPSGDFAAIIATNVIHISPWEVSQGLFAGAGRYLAPHGHLFLYGPFARDGAHTAESNARFDRSLRMENPTWGVRDIADLQALAAGSGLQLARIADMPRDNLVLVFSRNGQA